LFRGFDIYVKPQYGSWCLQALVYDNVSEPSISEKWKFITEIELGISCQHMKYFVILIGCDTV
jgi:hypothetical protein